MTRLPRRPLRPLRTLLDLPRRHRPAALPRQPRAEREPASNSVGEDGSERSRTSAAHLHDRRTETPVSADDHSHDCSRNMRDRHGDERVAVHKNRCTGLHLENHLRRECRRRRVRRSGSVATPSPATVRRARSRCRRGRDRSSRSRMPVRRSVRRPRWRAASPGTRRDSPRAGDAEEEEHERVPGELLIREVREVTGHDPPRRAAALQLQPGAGEQRGGDREQRE